MSADEPNALTGVPDPPADAHPEATCQRCGRSNRSWVVDSDRFNAAMRGLGLTRAAIVCPICFIEGHEVATELSCSWELVPATPFRTAAVPDPEETL